MVNRRPRRTAPSRSATLGTQGIRAACPGAHRHGPLLAPLLRVREASMASAMRTDAGLFHHVGEGHHLVDGLPPATVTEQHPQPSDDGVGLPSPFTTVRQERRDQPAARAVPEQCLDRRRVHGLERPAARPAGPYTCRAHRQARAQRRIVARETGQPGTAAPSPSHRHRRESFAEYGRGRRQLSCPRPCAVPSHRRSTRAEQRRRSLQRRSSSTSVISSGSPWAMASKAGSSSRRRAGRRQAALAAVRGVRSRAGPSRARWARSTIADRRAATDRALSWPRAASRPARRAAVHQRRTPTARRVGAAAQPAPGGPASHQRRRARGAGLAIATTTRRAVAHDRPGRHPASSSWLASCRRSDCARRIEDAWPPRRTP